MAVVFGPRNAAGLRPKGLVGRPVRTTGGPGGHAVQAPGVACNGARPSPSGRGPPFPRPLEGLQPRAWAAAPALPAPPPPGLAVPAHAPFGRGRPCVGVRLPGVHEHRRARHVRLSSQGGPDVIQGSQASAPVHCNLSSGCQGGMRKGGGGQKHVYQELPRKYLSIGDFRCFPRWSLWSGGGRTHVNKALHTCTSRYECAAMWRQLH